MSLPSKLKSVLPCPVSDIRGFVQHPVKAQLSVAFDVTLILCIDDLVQDDGELMGDKAFLASCPFYCHAAFTCIQWIDSEITDNILLVIAL